MNYIVHGVTKTQTQLSDFHFHSHIAGDSLPAEPQGKPKNTGVGSLRLLQGIFLTWESSRGLLHCRRILYQLSSPNTAPNVSSMDHGQQHWYHLGLC